jgi:hypothetical protein
MVDSDGELMSKDRKTEIVEAKELERLLKGSYENLLQAISEAVEENEKFFGGKAHLFSTYADHVVVFVEGKGFLSCNYSMKSGKSGIAFTELKEEKVAVLSEDTLLTMGSEALLKGDKDRVSSILRTLATINSTTTVPVKDHIESVFDNQRTWMSYICGDRKDAVTEYVGGDVGSFDRRYVGEDGSVDGYTLTRSLSDLSSKLGALNAKALSSMDDYREMTGDGRSVEEEAVLSEFDSVAGDFLEAIDSAIDLVSVALSKAKAGDTDFAAKIHDRVAEQIGNLTLGSDFVSKMSGELKAV